MEIDKDRKTYGKTGRETNTKAYRNKGRETKIGEQDNGAS
jgi:hypothetical protein